MFSMTSMVKRAAYSVGLDIRRFTPYHHPGYQLKTALDHFKVDCVFDVGANTGQFGVELREVGYEGGLVSFEPLSEAHTALTETAKGDPKWRVHPRSAIGDHDGEIAINISRNLVSSSILPMLSAHSDVEKDSAYVGTEQVPIHRLDTIAQQYLSGSVTPFLKIDTQGFEPQVLDGAAGVLGKMKGVLLELSIVPLYERQKLWRDMVERLEGEGFTLWAIQKGFTDLKTGRSMQMDGIFFRA